MVAVTRTDLLRLRLRLIVTAEEMKCGGVNMSFADGSSRFVADSIDYRVYQALMSPHGAESDVPEPAFELTDAAVP